MAVGLDALASADASMLSEQLSGLAERIVLGDVTGKNQILDAALLVQRATRTQTDEGVARLSRTLPDRLRLRYIGPQPLTPSSTASWQVSRYGPDHWPLPGHSPRCEALLGLLSR
jgi:Gas vesicle synthesis protein GvpL/GvpF